MCPRKCIVIGAGLAGLSAAYRAIQNGWEVDLLEASDRHGGRVFTGSHHREGRKPLVYELGGEWIGKDHKRVKALCNHFHLKRIGHRFSIAFWHPGQPLKTYRPGVLPFPKTARTKFREFCRQVKKYDASENEDLDRMDWWTRLKQLGFSRTDLERRELMDSTDFGESIRQTSAFVAATEYAFSDPFDEMDQKIAEGNDRLTEALAAAIGKKPNSIHKNYDVKHIVQANGIVTVSAPNRRPLHGEACICAIPAPCLTEIQWAPLLPVDQREAAEELQYARIVKTAVLFQEKIWKKRWPLSNKSGFSMFSGRVSDFCFESTFRQTGPEGIICSYAIGDKADDLAREAHSQVAEWISGDVSEAVGVKPNTPAAFLDQKAWQDQEHISGAYAFYRPGQWFSVRPALARAHGRVLFAGEHLSEDWQGFMEGAVETGQAAADAL
jgi:monoamine oxidase